MTVPITTRSGKGSELTWAEVDGNFTALKDAVEVIQDTPVQAPIIVSSAPPNNADGRPDGTIYIQTGA